MSRFTREQNEDFQNKSSMQAKIGIPNVQIFSNKNSPSKAKDCSTFSSLALQAPTHLRWKEKCDELFLCANFQYNQSEKH
jgi:hypothetical protein